MSAASQRAHARSTDVFLRRYIVLCVLVAVVVGTLVAVLGPGRDLPVPEPWVVALLWVAMLVGGAVTVGLPTSGVGGVRESTSLLELSAVLLLVYLPPGSAVLVAATASLVCEAVIHRHERPKVVFNTASEATSVALGAAVYQALAGPSFDGSLGFILAALAAAAIYILVNVGLFTGLVAVMTGDAWQAVRSQEMASSLLVSGGIATTGVMAAVLAGVAPWALPLIVVPSVLDRLRARGRQQGLELAASKHAAEQANRAKSEFLSRMSHELRTPLNAVLGFGQFLENDPRLDADSKEYVQVILRSGWHLRKIVDEVLDLSQIEAGRLTLSMESVRVAEVAAESLDLIVPLATERNIRTELVVDPPDLTVTADHQRLRQVLINLVSNAVKYNDDGGEAVVRARRTDGRVSIDVIDNGLGISEEDLLRLYVPFERLSRERSEVEGTGLGLSVTRNFVDAMGGELRVTSTLGEGSRFTVLLPAGEPAPGGR